MNNHSKIFLLFNITIMSLCLSACSVQVQYNNPTEVTDDKNISSESDSENKKDISDEESAAEIDSLPDNSDSDDKIAQDAEPENVGHRTVDPGLYIKETYYDFGENSFTFYQHYELYEDGTGEWNIQDNGPCTWDDEYIDRYTYDYDGNTLTLFDDPYTHIYNKHTQSVVKTMESTLSPTNIPDGVYYLDFFARNIENNEGLIYLTADIYEDERFDINAIDNLQLGDAVFTEEYNISIVEYIEKNDKTVRINGRDAHEGVLFIFTKDDRNNYYLASEGSDSTYKRNTRHYVSTMSLPLSDSFTFEYYDKSSDNTIIFDRDDFIKYVNKEKFGYRMTATVQDGAIVKLIY